MNHMKNQDNISPPEISNPIIIAPDKIKLSDVQDNDFKIAIINALKDFEYDTNKCLNEGLENICE